MPRKMRRGKGEEACCGGPRSSCCKVEAVVSIDHRGQMVLPKELRDRAGIKAGDKLAIMLWESEGKACCMTLMRAEELVEMVRNRLGPVVKDLFKE